MKKHYFELDAIGTHWWIEWFARNHNNKVIQDSVANKIRSFEERFSRFIPTSYISRLNKTKKLHFEDNELYEVITFGLDIAQKTNGLFTPLIGTYLEHLGYDANYSFMKDTLKHEELRNNSKPEVLELTTEYITLNEIAFFDIGGYGKGWLVDSISSYLEEQGITIYSINAGGDMMLKGWDHNPVSIHLEDPQQPGIFIGELVVSSGAFAASSGSRRAWKDKEGNAHHHIIDPKTGFSANAVSGVFTSAHSCLHADVASTLLMIQPDYPITTLFDKVEYLIISTNGRYFKTPGYVGTLYT